MGSTVINLQLDFDNGYTASVLRASDEINGSYGYSQGLYELAVLHNNEIITDTPVTGDVLGYLTVNDVIDAMNRIKALPPRVVLAR